MLVLALDTATPACAVGVCRVEADEVGVLAEAAPVDPRRHGELLAPTIRDVLTQAGCHMPDVEGIAVGLGPGPFTSLRVGIVTAAGLADALGVPVSGICTLDAMAAVGGTSAVLTDARRREVYWATYRDGVRLRGPEVARPDAAILELTGEGIGRVGGDAARLYEDVLTSAGLDVADELPRYPAIDRLAALAFPDGEVPGELATLAPLYLRRPDAAEPRRQPTEVTR